MKNWTRDFKFDRGSVQLIAAQALRGVALGLGVYVTWGIGVGATLLLLGNTLGVIQSGYATVLYEPFVVPLLAMCLLAGLFVALVAGLSVAREREMGTLETLLYGPIHYREYILGKLLGHLAAYGLVLMAFLATCAVLGAVTHLVFTLSLLYVAGLSVLVALALIGLGLLCAALMRSVRGTLLLFLGLALVMVALPFGAGLLTAIVSSQGFLQLIVLRDTLEVAARIVAFISPVSYLVQGADGFARESWSDFALYLGASFLYALVLWQASSRVLARRGVTR